MTIYRCRRTPRSRSPPTLGGSAAGTYTRQEFRRSSNIIAFKAFLPASIRQKEGNFPFSDRQCAAPERSLWLLLYSVHRFVLCLYTAPVHPLFIANRWTSSSSVFYRPFPVDTSSPPKFRRNPPAFLVSTSPRLPSSYRGRVLMGPIRRPARVVTMPRSSPCYLSSPSPNKYATRKGLQLSTLVRRDSLA